MGRIAGVTGLLLALGPQAVMSQDGTVMSQDGTAAQAGSKCPVETDAEGNRRWTGAPTPEASVVADTLQSLADEHPDEVSGVAFCSDYSGVEIFVKGEAAGFRQAVQEVAGDAPDVQVYTPTVRYSLTDLLAMSSQVMGSHPDVLGAGPDPTLDAVVVQVGATSPAEVAGIVAQRGPIIDAVREFVGVDASSLVFRVGGVGEDSANRLEDNPALSTWEFD